MDAQPVGHHQPACRAVHGRDLWILPAGGQYPPSKAPLLTLLKQARVFGVGVVLAT